MGARYKLLVALGAGSLAVAALVGYLIWSGYRDALHVAKVKTSDYAEILGARLAATLRRADAELQQLARTFPLAALSADAVSRNAHIDAELKARLNLFPELDSLIITDVSGDVLYMSRDSAMRPNLADRSYFRALRDDPRAASVFSEVILTRITGRPGVAFARPLRDEQGVFRGMVAVLLELDHFQKLFQTLDVGVRGNVAIYRNDDFTQVLRWPVVEGKLNVALPPNSPTRAALAGGVRTATVELPSAADGAVRIYSYQSLERYPFFISVGVARDEVLANWRTRSLLVSLITLLLGGLLIGAVLRLWLTDAARARLAAIVENSHDAVISRTLDGTILTWNAGADRLLGYTAAEAVGKPICLTLPPGRPIKFPQYNEALIRGEVVVSEFQRMTKDGRLIDVAASATPARDGAGNVVGASIIMRDITERKQAEAVRAQLAAILETSGDAIVGRAPDDTIVHWNAAAERMFGWSAQEALGKTFRRLLSTSPDVRRQGRFEKALLGETAPPSLEDIRLCKDGSTIHVHTTMSAVSDERGEILFISCIMRDVTEKLKAERRIEQLATKDELTGLSNRSRLMEQMQTGIARAARAQAQLVVMFIDLDHFKSVNDTLGHDAGDELLRECARRLTECVREVDIVARCGGDEFVVLLTDVTDTALVAPIAGRMLKLLTTPYHVLGHEALTSASIGICFYPTDGNDVSTLMKYADIAMYHAKAQHRNNYQFYSEEMNQRMLQRLQLEKELHAAVENNEFVLHYQPQVAFAGGEILGAESLVRWQHPTRGLLLPAEFIPVAEDTGLIVPLGAWILNHACRTIKTWRMQGVAIPHIVVNVAAAQLDEALVKSVQQALVDHDIKADWLILEITETMLIKQVENAITILSRIRALGIRIAMDDFGTGYSSLSLLQRLPLDTLKIDRNFVIGIDDAAECARACAIIGAIVAIAKALKLNVVAEGVESASQLAFLRTLNCDAYQGFFYSEPVDQSTLEARLAAPA